MPFQVDDIFTVKAPLERVWTFLTDPRKIVQCLPGATLLEVQDDRTFAGEMTAMIGPVSMRFQGRVQLAEVNESEKRLFLTGEGREGGGWIRGSLLSLFDPTPDDGTRVTVHTKLDIDGLVVQLGKSYIQSIMKQQIQKFAESVRKEIAKENEPSNRSTTPP